MRRADGEAFAALEMSGADRVDFLHRLVSNSVKLEAGQGVHCYLLTTNGRPQLELWVYELGDRFWLVVPRSQFGHAFRDLDNYLFADKVKIVPSAWKAWIELGEGPPGPPRARAGEGEVRCTLPYFGVSAELVWTAAGAQPQPDWLSPDELEILRVEAGSPSPAEYTEKTMFLEVAGPDAYSETKGCYPGQEVVARTLHRGHINRALKGIKATEPLPPEGRLLSGGKEVGWIARSLVSPRLGPIGLAFVRREVWEDKLPMQLDDGRPVELRD